MIRRFLAWFSAPPQPPCKNCQAMVQKIATLQIQNLELKTKLDAKQVAINFLNQQLKS